MPTPASFPLHDPSLTRIHKLDNIDAAVEDIKLFIKENLALILLGIFDDSTTMLASAQLLCTEDTAPPNQRVLWIKDIELQAAVKPVLEAAIQAGFPGKEVSYDNIRALTVVPDTGAAAYLIFKDPALSPDPTDSRKKLSKFQMSRAFFNLIKNINANSDPS